DWCTGGPRRTWPARGRARPRSRGPAASEPGTPAGGRGSSLDRLAVRSLQHVAAAVDGVNQLDVLIHVDLLPQRRYVNVHRIGVTLVIAPDPLLDHLPRQH